MDWQCTHSNTALESPLKTVVVKEFQGESSGWGEIPASPFAPFPFLSSCRLPDWSSGGVLWLYRQRPYACLACQHPDGARVPPRGLCRNTLQNRFPTDRICENIRPCFIRFLFLLVKHKYHCRCQTTFKVYTVRCAKKQFQINLQY